MEKNHLRSMLRVVFGFKEREEKAAYGLGYKSTITTEKDEAALHKTVALADARVKIDLIHWYVPSYTLLFHNKAS